MQQSERRIGKLRVKSQDEESLSTDLNNLQDAFKTASFSGLPPNGLLLIRRFDLGVIRSRSSAMSISKLIDEKIRSASYQMVCVDVEDHPNEDVVWFSDMARAVFALLTRMLSGSNLEAWYWPVMFPSFNPAMSIGDVLTIVNTDYADKQSKSRVLALVVEDLLKRGRSDDVIKSISTQLAQECLRECGLLPHVVSASVNEKLQTTSRPAFQYPLKLKPEWRAILQQAIPYWGKTDLRSYWLAYSALISTYPAMAENSEVWPRILDLINSVDRSHKIEQSDRAIKDDQVETNFLTVNENADTREKLIDSVIRSVVPKETQKANRNNCPDRKRGAVDSEFNEAGLDVTDNLIFNQNGFIYSQYSGLGFLISLLDMISIKQLMSLNPLLAEVNLPVRIIARIAERVGIPGSHPLIQSLPEYADIDIDEINSFVCADEWRQLVISNHESGLRLCRFMVDGDKNKCFITDRHKRLLLYVGNPSITKLPDWIAEAEIIEQSGRHPSPTLGNIQTTIHLLLSRFLYRYATMSLRSLIKRDGQIAATKTHLDFLFDMNQLDIRIRKAGIDINPGWVSWLGMVVEFHYDNGESDHA